MPEVVRWEEPTGRTSGRSGKSGDWAKLADALRSNPNRWAVIYEGTPTYATARTESGKGLVYARYIGGDGGTPNAQ